MKTITDISFAHVLSIATEQGFIVVSNEESSALIRDPDSGIALALVLEEDVLYCTVPLATIPEDALTTQHMRTMLDADNAINTSSFRLHADGAGKVNLLLNNFCTLQTLGTDDRHDIISCLEFLLADAITARRMFPDLSSSTRNDS